MKKSKLAPYIYVSPAILLMLVFTAFPAIQSIYLSFFNWDGFSSKTFCGIMNYIKIINSDEFPLSLKNNLLFFLMTGLGTIVLGLIIALAISNHKRVNFYRFVFYLPVIISTSAAAYLWNYVYEPNFGILNTVLKAIGLNSLAQNWLGDDKTVLASIAVTAVWQGVGLTILLFITAINNIPDDLYESAFLEGINVFQKALYITIPLIRNVIVTIGLLSLLNAFKAFDLIYVMTNGGPGTSSYVLGILMYRKAFEGLQYNFATAVGVIAMIIVGVISVIYMKTTGYYEESVEY